MKNFKRSVIYIIIIVIICTIIPLDVNAEKEMYTTARYAIAIDAKTKIPLYEKNSDILVPIASTTKIITSLVAIKYGDLDKKIEISKRASNMGGSTVGYRKGEQITLRELLFGLMLRSGNDAAIAIAEGISGSVEEYVKLMNEYSSAIGLVNSHFETPHGLDRDFHYSTAYDLAVASAKARENPLFNEIVSSKDVDEKKYNFTRSYHNINKILWQIPEANGVKTGFTGKAGKCLVTSLNVSGNDVIIVVLNCSERWRETKKIYDYIIQNYHYEKIYSKGDIVGEVSLPRGSIKLKAKSDINIPMQNGAVYDSLIIKPRKVNIDINEGDDIGTLKILKNGEKIYLSNLSAASIYKARKNKLKFLFKH